MQCKNCGAELPVSCALCPVCGKETTKYSTSRIPRLIIGGAVVLLVCICIVLAFMIQNRVKTPLDEEVDLSSFSLIDPELDPDMQATSSLPFSNGAYALTDEEGRPLGTYSITIMSREELQAMDNQTFLSFWDNAVQSEDLYSTIALDNGCGIVFSSGNTSTAVYGTLDQNAYTADVYGTVIRQDDGKISFLANDPSITDPFSEDEQTTAVTPIGNVIVTTEPDTSESAAQTVEEAQKEPAQTVYITDSGEKFHRADCSFLNESSHEISRAEAEEKGYTACSRCEP